jgi:leucyl/phenylalanyl-tRNA--protein transferase
VTLTPDYILAVYHQGYFPMASGRHGAIGFHYFEPRAIIPLDDRFTIRPSLRRVIEQQTFTTTIDTAFETVIRSCARYGELPDDEIWISEDMIGLYCELHEQGIAHSVETWLEGELVGGLYGLSLGKVFCGESMFSKRSYASQVALVRLVDWLRENNVVLLDAQMDSEHLKQFGAYTISQVEYLQLLSELL